MATQRQAALKGVLTPQMKAVGKDESRSPADILNGLAKGTLSIPYNPLHKNCRPTGIGRGLRTKVNANIGTSADYPHLKIELKKLEAALAAKTDAVMDLSTGGNINATRKAIMAACPVPVGTVPIYQAVVEKKMTVEGMFSVVEAQAKEGVDFMTIHCGVTRTSVAELKKHPRLMEVVSRGGALLMKWIIDNDQENPFYEHYDRLLEIAAKYDVTLSLGDGMRPGSVVDAGDAAQIKELKILGQLTKLAWRAGVQVIIEGPGHVPYNQIVAQMKMEKKFCHGAPFYVLGPLPTDVAPGYDHITAAIGGTLAAVSGAHFLCYVTPTEHLGLPEAEDVKAGVIASRIAAHCADLANGIPGAIEWDRAMSKARKELNWKKQVQLAIDPVKAKAIHEKRKRTLPVGRQATNHPSTPLGASDPQTTCSMCGEFCAYKVSSEALQDK